MEVLAVVLITTLVVVAITPAFLRAAASDPLAQAVSTLHEIDRLARQQAVGIGGSWSVVEGKPVSGISGWQPTGDLPAECRVTFLAVDGGEAGDHSVLENVVLDRSGCSADVRLLVTYGERTRQFRIHGLCGRWDVEEVGR